VHLRDYQIRAVDSVNRALAKHPKVVLSAATGSGKSAMIAELCRQAEGRVLVLCHQAEILSQNARALLHLTGETASIYCAGLDSKSLAGRVVIAHRDSLANVKEPGEYPTVVIDECHLISHDPESRYHTILSRTNPDRVIGMTATPYRLQGGKIYGKNRFFDVCADTISIGELIEQEYLCPYEAVDIDPIFETSDIDTKAGDFDIKQLDAKGASKLIVKGSVAAIEKHTGNRNLGVIFCTGKGHARAIQEALGMKRCGYIDGDTPADRRERIISELRAGDSPYKWIANVGVLTTGVDIPRIDSVIMLRPTQSAGLWVQCVGRGLRMHTSKSTLKILELTDNLNRFGSLESPMLFGTAKPPSDDITVGEAAVGKECPSCEMMVGNATRECPHCGHLFLKQRELYEPGEILELDVHNYRMEDRITRAGAPCVVVTFKTELGVIQEWLLTHSTHEWQRQTAFAKLRKLRADKVTMIRATQINAPFPKVMSYHSV